MAKSALQRQKEARARKKKKGKFINIFVPNNVVKQLNGRPSMLVKHFQAFSDLIKIIESQKAENDLLRQKLDEATKALDVINEKWLKIYNNTKIPEYLGLKKDALMPANLKAIKKIERKKPYTWNLDNLIHNQDYLNGLTTKYIDFIKEELYKCHNSILEIRQKLIYIFDMDEKRRKLIIREVKNICWELTDKKIFFDRKEEQMYYKLKKILLDRSSLPNDDSPP
ncbi:MAG: hypothetical protein BWX92_02554 [Deltaproteobacteria bacterium ADurb.Bin135]|nr:MAG: hypothetical protein BWX92_02554 [Deltaproteobacteria bacterium ADurb.Bin135]